MRVTIITDDGLVYVEGQPLSVDLSAIDEDIHAVQWYGVVGEVEFKTDLVNDTRRPNERITDFSPYQQFVDAWEIAAQEN